MGSKPGTICFVNLPQLYLNDPRAQPPLGLLYVVSAARGLGHEVLFADLSDTLEGELLARLPEAEVYGVSASSLDIKSAEKVATLAKERNPEARVILGGSHASSWGEKGTYSEVFDAVVFGEGEGIIGQVIEDLRNGRSSRFYRGPRMEDIDLIPLPARDVLTKQGAPIFAFGKDYKSGGHSSIITSRGCPYRCAFCESPKIWNRRVCFRSVENVVQEIETVIDQYGIYQYRFQDDTMTLDKRRMFALCERFAALGIYWRCSLRVDNVDEKLFAAMYEGGCREVGFGIESGDQQVLDVLQKGTTVAQNARAVKMAKEAGFTVRVFLMSGTPGETRETPYRTIDFLERTKPDIATLAVFAPFPGSEIFDHPERFGTRIKSRNLDEYFINTHRDHQVKSVISIDGLTDEELEHNKSVIRDYIYGKGIANG